MGNSLLDFVMALVRDPEVAARYAADPAGALAAAGLTGVTSTDVTNLIPVVTDSLAMSTPGFGEAADPNVWNSGAAAAAFDAFAIRHPQSPEPLSVQVNAPVIAHSDAEPPAVPVSDIPIAEDVPAVEPAGQDWPGIAAWPDGYDAPGRDGPHDPQPDHHTPEHPGFDVF